MAMLAQCPVCKASCSVAEANSGTPVRCPKCLKPFVVKQTVDGQKGDTNKNRPASNTNPFPVLPAEFGRYRILKLLGRGGMGAVYLAQDSHLGRQVALKVPFFDASESPQRAERFVREARSAAVLDHPNICTVFDAGQISGRLFITMAYIAGTPLEEEIDPEIPMPQLRAAEIVRKIALALEHAHRKGTVHRDLKPENVMMSASGEPVVMDFGLAKRVGGEPGQAKLTHLGAVLGTPSYMSPEQVKGEVQAIGPATDVYSLGVVLFEMLTGKTPYTGAFNSVVGQILTAPVPPVKEFRPDVDSRLDAICRKAMAKEPADRFPSMAEFAEALGKVLKAPSAPAPPLPAPPVAAILQAPLPAVDRSPFGDLEEATPPKPALKKAKRGRVVAVANRPPKWAIVAGATACLLLAGLAALWASGVFKVKTADGILVVQVNEPNAEVFVDGDRMTVSWNDGGTKAEIHVKPGTRKVEVKKDGFGVDGTDLTFRDGDRVVFTARLLPDQRVAKADQPPPERPSPPPTPAATGENPADITNSIGMKLKLIKPGKFLMGSPKEEEGREENEGPQHEVEITKAFYMGACPVTRGQFAAFVKDDGYQTEAEKDGKGGFGLNLATAKWEQKLEYTWRHPGFTQGDDHPVVEVSWNDATAFCAWLSGKEGKTYELATEAEWEYACRAGTTTRFWCGDADDSLQGNANIADASLREKCAAAFWAAAWGDGYAFTSPVGKFKPNPWGLYDMGGNVWQWCADGYGPYQKGYIEDPNNKDSVDSRVLRGGSWRGDPRNSRSANRYGDDPAYRSGGGGFRVVVRLPAMTP